LKKILKKNIYVYTIPMTNVQQILQKKNFFERKKVQWFQSEYFKILIVVFKYVKAISNFQSYLVFSTS
jgi:hypothetical protein